ncbi:MAG: hypothetical protein IPL21_00150 [Saprospirales bacterium]|nr:hypothetical protein [Saprospirales bacterium]
MVTPSNPALGVTVFLVLVVGKVDCFVLTTTDFFELVVLLFVLFSSCEFAIDTFVITKTTKNR